MKHSLLSKRYVVFWAVLLGITLSSSYFLGTREEPTEKLPLPVLAGDPDRGGTLFSEFGCGSCHSLYGNGPTIGPDLGRVALDTRTPAGLVAQMWSHSPEMWEKIAEAQITFPRIAPKDMLDLLAFLYLIRYADEPGDPANGRLLFSTKQCSHCHALSENGNGTGPDLSHLGGGTPIIWAQRMWNHGRAMQKTMDQKDLRWPTFQDREMVDLLSYVQQSASGARREAALFPATPAKGQTLFHDKGCILCHSINGEGGKVGPDLGGQHHAPPSITQFAGLMWNHLPQMLERMDKEKIGQAWFAEQEMADLISYLYAVRYLEPVGRVDYGKEIFNKKHCANCHGENGHGGKIGPNLTRRGEYVSSEMAYTVWTHGPQMYRKMRDKNIPWPTLEESELVDLIAFLNSI